MNGLKTMPTWNELEQLLDDPYKIALCSTYPTASPFLIGNTPGNAQGWPSFCTSPSFVRRPSFGSTLPPLFVDPLNYNPTTGEYMRMLNPNYSGGTYAVAAELVNIPNTTTYIQLYDTMQVSSGTPRVSERSIDYNGPLSSDLPATVPGSRAFLCGLPFSTAQTAPFVVACSNRVRTGNTLQRALAFLALRLTEVCIATTETIPPEGSTLCGGDLGEPTGYSSLATGSASKTAPGSLIEPETAAPLVARDFVSGLGGLEKPSVTISGTLPDGVTTFTGSQTSPAYTANVDPENMVPSNENDYIRCDNSGDGFGAATTISSCTFENKQNARLDAMVLGKSLFWDMQVGSDGVQSCGTCHFHAGADSRTKNQINPNHLSNDLTFDIPVNANVVRSDFPLHKLTQVNRAGDPACTSALTARVNAGVLENIPSFALTGATFNPITGVTMNVCQASNNTGATPSPRGLRTTNDVVSSMGVHFGMFGDIPTIGTFSTNAAGVNAVVPDVRSTLADGNIDPIPGFQGASGTNGIRRVEPRNTPTVFLANANFDNFWDGRARHDFNGGSVFGAADPQNHVWVSPDGTELTATRQLIKFSSLASLATGPGLSEFEMSQQGRNWSKIGKKLLQAGVTPLANQLVALDDGILGRYSNQGGTACSSVPGPDQSPMPPGGRVAGVPGLCISYQGLIKRAFHPYLWQNTSVGLDGCYTDGRADHTNQCGTGIYPAALVQVLENGAPASHNNDPFDHYVLNALGNPVDAAETNRFTQMEGNFSLFWGLSVSVWATVLIPDNTPFDQFLDVNPDAFAALGEPGEPGLVSSQPNCTSATQRDCFRPVGNFRRDNNISTASCAAQGLTLAQCRGTRNPSALANQPDPLLGLDIFFASNLSNKNPNFRTGRCGECHAVPTLTDNTMPFTFKATLRDFVREFVVPGQEATLEPLGRNRIISGYLLESEMNEPGQDGVERRIANQSIVPNPSDGLAYPDGLLNPNGTAVGNEGNLLTGTVPGDNRYVGAGQSFFDNGVYNLGVTPCVADDAQVTGRCDDNGRGNTDAFGWPLSLASLMLKNLGGPAQEPGSVLNTFICSNGCDATLDQSGGLFEETTQDQQINPGFEGEPANALLPLYLAPYANQINVGDGQPDLDEMFGAINTLTDVPILEGFIDVLGPVNPAGVLNEALNMADGPVMGTWPVVNRVGRFGSFKAAQLREVDLTGPYFHNGGKLTLRQVVDFYARGGDFPVTNAKHRDFNVVNLNVDVQSNLSEAEKVSLVDFLLELTDDRVLNERAPFDHPQMIVPLDGTAPENTTGRDAMLASCVSFTDPLVGGGPGRQSCAGGLFMDVPAVGAGGNPAGPLPRFLGLSATRLSGLAANCGLSATSQYCH
jgi:cytochrome c peroxidase